jgi:hypothetical protein
VRFRDRTQHLQTRRDYFSADAIAGQRSQSVISHDV